MMVIGMKLKLNGAVLYYYAFTSSIYCIRSGRRLRTIPATQDP